MREAVELNKNQVDDSWEFLPLDEAFCCVPEASMTVANCADERMAAVFEHVVALYEEGADPADVIIMASCPESAEYLHEFLQGAVAAIEDEDDESGEVDEAGEVEGEATAGDLMTDESADLRFADFVSMIQVTWARDVACAVLATPEAQAVTGRHFAGDTPRILSAFEEDFLMEDLKTWGSRPKRLRELCKFLYRGITELADEASHWLIMVEEIEVYRFMRRELEYLGALLEPEVSNLATKALRGDETLRAGFAYEHVIAYDYQYLSRASQLLCHLLANHSLFAVAGVNATVEVYERYPFGRGVEEFTRINPQAEVTWAGVSGAGVKTHLVWPDATAEFEGVAQAIAEKIAQGLSPESIGVVCFHPYWASQVKRALQALNIPVNSWYKGLSLRGDIRENALCVPLRVITLLHLLVNDCDSVSWRAWFGFGDYLARSADFKEMRETAQAENSQARFVTMALESEWGAAVCEALERCKPLRGTALLEALLVIACTDGAYPEGAAEGTFAIPAQLRLLAALGEEATAGEMIAHLDALQFAGGLGPNAGAVVTSLAGAASRAFDEVFVVGFVNGLFPVHDYFDLTKITVDKQQKMAAENEETVELLKMLARREIVVSTFETIDVELARKTQVKMDRIFQDFDGVQKSNVSESLCLKQLLGA